VEKTLVVIRAHFDDGVFPWPFYVYSDDPGMVARIHLQAICRKAVEEREQFGEEAA
jgi:hypothetical protein